MTARLAANALWQLQWNHGGTVHASRTPSLYTPCNGTASATTITGGYIVRAGQDSKAPRDMTTLHEIISSAYQRAFAARWRYWHIV